MNAKEKNIPIAWLRMKADHYYNEARDLWKKGKIPESNRSFTKAIAYEEILKEWKEENE